MCGKQCRDAVRWIHIPTSTHATHTTKRKTKTIIIIIKRHNDSSLKQDTMPNLTFCTRTIRMQYTHFVHTHTHTHTHRMGSNAIQCRRVISGKCRSQYRILPELSTNFLRMFVEPFTCDLRTYRAITQIIYWGNDIKVNCPPRANPHPRPALVRKQLSGLAVPPFRRKKSFCQ